MKKALVLFLLFGLLFVTGCDPASFYYDYEEFELTVESVEIIDYDNDDAVEVFESRDKVKAFDFSKMTVIDVISTEKTNDFLLELSQITFLYVWRHYDSPKGECVKINYKDGSFDIISCDVTFSCQYDKSGNVKKFIGTGGGQTLKDLIKEYLAE